MNVLIIGSGGREHTFAWKIAQSPKIDQLYIAPGNAGTHDLGTNLNIDGEDFEGIPQSCREQLAGAMHPLKSSPTRHPRCTLAR